MYFILHYNVKHFVFHWNEILRHLKQTSDIENGASQMMKNYNNK